MANQKFLEKIKNQISVSSSSKDFESSNNYSYEEDNVTMESLGTNNLIKDNVSNIEEQNEEEINKELDEYLKDFNGNNTINEKIKETIEEDFGCSGDSKPIDLSNLPSVNLDENESECTEEKTNNFEELNIDNSNLKVFEEDIEYYNETTKDQKDLNTEKEEIKNIENKEKEKVESKIEKQENSNTIKEEVKQNDSENNNISETKVKRRGPGRPKASEVNKMKNEENIETKENKEIKHDENINTDIGKLAENILNCVCNNTIRFLSENYKSHIYTEEFTKKLFNQFMNGELDGSNPLLNELIKECSNSDIEDPYLGKLTKDVLNYIKGRNV